MNPIISFTIPINPMTKKNSQQIFWNKKINRPFITQSERYKNYEKEACNFIPKIETPIDYPVRVKATYYRGSRHLVDINNLNQALHDIMVKYEKCRNGIHCYILVRFTRFFNGLADFYNFFYTSGFHF